jgi:hypothetical protein
MHKHGDILFWKKESIIIGRQNCEKNVNQKFILLLHVYRTNEKQKVT